MSGITEEQVELYAPGNKWTVSNLSSGTHHSEEQSTAITFSPWDTSLYKRGFVDMVDDWIRVVRSNTDHVPSLQDVWATHRLCETILEEVRSQ